MTLTASQLNIRRNPIEGQTMRTIRKIYESNSIDGNKLLNILILIIQIPIFYFLKLFGLHNRGYE